jgi:hypothetical protein
MAATGRMSLWLRATGTIYALGAVDFLLRPRAATVSLSRAAGGEALDDEPGVSTTPWIDARSRRRAVGNRLQAPGVQPPVRAERPPATIRRFEVHEFAIVVLLGIGTFKVVDMLTEYVDLSKVQSILTIALGALVAWALEFSLFAQWEIPVRSELLGYVGTGLMIAAAGYATPKVFEHVAEVLGHRREVRTPKAA